MKAFRTIILLTILSVASLTSCSKKADDVTPGQTTTTQSQGFQVKVDGADYAPDFSYALASFPGANGYIAIYGLDSNTSNVVAIALPNTVGEGTYPINNVNFGIVTYNKADYSTINGGSGTITITKKTAAYMTGTFSFIAYDATGTLKRTLTEGTFNVNFK